jgi:hypothetical protein
VAVVELHVCGALRKDKFKHLHLCCDSAPGGD